jgi:hypothetical protein
MQESEPVPLISAYYSRPNQKTSASSPIFIPPERTAYHREFSH